MITYLISLIGYLILFVIIRHLYVPSSANTTYKWKLKDSDYTEKLKISLWIYILYFIGFLIPIINLLCAYSTIIVLAITINIDQWAKFRIESKFLNFLNKKI